MEVLELEEDLRDIDEFRKELAVFFCEDAASFKMEDCFKTLHTFCDRFKKAIEVSTSGSGSRSRSGSGSGRALSSLCCWSHSLRGKATGTESRYLVIANQNTQEVLI